MGQPWQMQDVFPTEAGLKDGESWGREKRLGEKEGSGTGSAFTDEKHTLQILLTGLAEMRVFSERQLTRDNKLCSLRGQMKSCPRHFNQGCQRWKQSRPWLLMDTL